MQYIASCSFGKDSIATVILAHLNNEPLDLIVFSDELGIADVRANIRDLRDLGYEILDRWVSGTNRRGRKTTYKEYFLSNVNN